MKIITGITAGLLLAGTQLLAQTILWKENRRDGRNFPFYTGGFHRISTEFADIDGDGDRDCFIGTQEGTISFFENVGNPESPIWKLITSDFLDIIPGPMTG